MRLLFDTKMTDTQKSKNHKLYYIGLCANVCENSFESTRARRTNKHVISSWFIAGFSPTTYESGWSLLKTCVCKHFSSWMNPINVTLNVHSKNPAFQAKHLKDPDQQLPGDVDTKQLAWKRAPIRSYFGSSSKAAPCLQIYDKVFWNSIDNIITTLVRDILVLCLVAWMKEEWKIFAKPTRGFICHGSKDEDEWVLAEKESRVWKCLVFLNKGKTKVKSEN